MLTTVLLARLVFLALPVSVVVVVFPVAVVDGADVVVVAVFPVAVAVVDGADGDPLHATASLQSQVLNSFLLRPSMKMFEVVFSAPLQTKEGDEEQEEDDEDVEDVEKSLSADDLF